MSNIASEISIISRDSNPLSQSMLDNMVKLDNLRNENYGKICRKRASTKAVDAAGSGNQNKNDADIDIQTDGENRGTMGGCPKTPVANSMQPILIED